MSTTEDIREEELHAWLDGELSAERAAIVEAYVEAHPAIAHRLEAYRADGASLARLFGRVGEPGVAVRSRPTAGALRWAAMVALVGGAASFGWVARDWSRPADEAAFVHEAAAAHALYLAGGPAPLDVGQPARLAATLGAPIRLPDTSDFGYALTAARLVPSPTGSAAQLVYSGGAEPITVYLRAAPGATDTPLRLTRQGSIATAAWEFDDVACAISGAVDPTLLEQFAQRLYAALES